jgi:hypothetical protein
VVNVTPRPVLPPGKGPKVPIGQEGGWAPELVWTQKARGKIICPCQGSNLDCPVVQSVARHYTELPRLLTQFSSIAYSLDIHVNWRISFSYHYLFDLPVTVRRGRVVNSLASCSGDPGFKSRPQTPVLRFFVAFLSPCKQIPG